MKILFISHETSRTGAPIVLLSILKNLKQNTNFTCDLILLGSGELENDFKETTDNVFYFKIYSTFIIKIMKVLFSENYLNFLLNKKIKKIKKNKYDLIYANSVLTMDIATKVKRILNVKAILHVHELEYAIKTIYGEDKFRLHSDTFNHFIAVSNVTKQNLIDNYFIKPQDITVVYPYSENKQVNPDKVIQLKNKYQIKPNTYVIGGAGQMSWTKGIDVFIQIANAYSKQAANNDFKFIWVGGGLDSTYFEQIKIDMKKMKLKDNIIFTDAQKDPYPFYSLFSVFLLTSKEESFGLVALENAFLSNPIICFEDCGGINEFIKDNSGIEIPYCDIGKTVTILNELQQNFEKRRLLGSNAQNKALTQFNKELFDNKIIEIIQNISGIKN